MNSRSAIGWVVLTAVSLFALAGLLFGQGQDRGVITGVVSDKTGSAIPQATVTVINEAQGDKITIDTTSSGNYFTTPLIPGKYKVQVEKSGFKTFVVDDVVVNTGTVRLDAILSVGQVTETVEVQGQTSAVEVNVSNAEVTQVLGEKYYRDLPVVMGADIRLAESLLGLEPGYVPMRPNGCPIFRGSQFESRMNGGQIMAMENYLDGASFGSAIDHNNTQERSVPFDSVQETKVTTSNFSAQYGRTSGGFVEYTTKSGTSAFHGGFYDYYGYQGLNATGELISQKTPTRNENWGFLIGGPVVIPHLYDGRKYKTYFFANLDDLHFGQGTLPSYGNTAPLTSFLQGDFSSPLLYTGQQVTQLVGTPPVATPVFDVLGRPIYVGEIYDPATTRTVGGVPVRDGFGFDPTTGLPISGLANKIPAGDPMLSAIAAKLVPLIPPPDLPNVLSHNAFAPSGNKWINPKTFFVRVDQAFGAHFNMSASVNINTRPSLRQCANFSEGCNYTTPATYFGQGFYQDITTRTAHVQFNWIIKPNLFNHTTVSFDRWVLPAHAISEGQHWVSRLGLIGPVADTGGAPYVYLNDPNIPYSQYGEADTNSEGCIANRWQFLDDITWVKGKHTIKAGFEYRHHQFPIQGNPNNTGSYSFSNAETANWNAAGVQQTATGDPTASFLLGQVDNANFNITTLFPMENEQYIAPWVNDEFKATRNLTLTLGLRFDYQGCLSEAHGNQSSFSPTTPNPGADGHLGAMIFAGKGAGRTGVKCFENPPKDAWGPRFGFAYRIDNKTSIRGGYGIYYGGLSANQFAGTANLGFSTNPTVPNFSNGYSPAFYWDTGFPSTVIQAPPDIDPTIANGEGPTWVTANRNNLPRYQNYSLSVERQIGTSMLVRAFYTGNHGTRLPDNAPSLGLQDNMNNPSILTTYTSAQLGAPATGSQLPYPTFVGDLAQALRPWPQYTNLNVLSVPYGNSHYNSFTAQLDKRFSSGLLARVAYVNSKLINSGAENALAGSDPGIQNPLRGALDDRALSVDDIPQTLIMAWSYELPFGKGKRYNFTGFLDKIAGGWMVSAAQRYEEGRPVTITMACDFCGYIFSNEKRPNRVSGVSGYGHFSTSNLSAYLVKGAWADPGALQFGDEPQNDSSVRLPHNFNEDFSIVKTTMITERVDFKFVTNVGNIFNRHLWCAPDMNWSDSTFGTVSSQCNTPRSVQFGGRLEF
jgi:hypothetical protein